MSTQRPAAPGKPRNDGTQPSAPQAIAGGKRQVEEADRQRNALENQGTQGRNGASAWTREKLLQESEDDDTATRH